MERQLSGELLVLGMMMLLMTGSIFIGPAQHLISETTLILAQSELASCYEAAMRPRWQKQAILKALSPYVDILEVFVYPGHLELTEKALRDIQDWIDIAHEEGLMIALSCETVPRERDLPKAVGFMKLKTPKPTQVVPEDGTLEELQSVDIADEQTVAEKAQRLRNFLSQIRGLDFFMFDETHLPVNAPEGFDDYLAEPPYFCSSTYSDTALADFRRYIGDETLRFPIRPQEKILASDEKKFVVTEDPKLWDRWWKWRFFITYRYIDALAKAAHEANAQNRRFRGVIYFGSNRCTYETAYNLQRKRRKIYAVNIDDLPFEHEDRIVPGIAASRYVDWLISEDGADGQNPTLGPSESVRFFKEAAQKYGKKWGNFVECWSYHNKKPGDVGLARRAIEITANYKCHILAMYEEGIFRKEQFEQDFHNYHPEMVALWEKLISPRQRK